MPALPCIADVLPANRRSRLYGILTHGRFVRQPLRFANEVGDEDQRSRNVESPFHFTLQDRATGAPPTRNLSQELSAEISSKLRYVTAHNTHASFLSLASPWNRRSASTSHTFHLERGIGIDCPNRHTRATHHDDPHQGTYPGTIRIRYLGSMHLQLVLAGA